jgi:hypothetical protein
MRTRVLPFLVLLFLASTAGFLASTASAQIIIQATPLPAPNPIPVNPLPWYTISAGAEALDSIQDLNGDGIRDLILGDPSNDRIQVRSGRNGNLLGSFTSPVSGCGFGHDVASTGDLDGDGFEDILVGEPGCTGTETAYAISSGTFGLLLSWTSSAGGAGGGLYGTAVSRASDLNGDGIEEVLVSAPLYAPVGSSHVGLVEVLDLSGGTATVIGSLFGTIPYDEFGDSLAFLGDVDGDSIGDFVVGTTRFFAPGGVVCQSFNLPGVHRVYSGAALTLISTATGVGPGDTFGFSVGAVDADGDGINDVVTGAPDFCGATGPAAYTTTGLTIPSPVASCLHFGWAVSGVGNIVGNNFEEFVVTAPSVFGGCGPAARAFLFNGRNGNLVSTFKVGGASQTFGHDVTELDVVAGRTYFAIADKGAGRVHVYRM